VEIGNNLYNSSADLNARQGSKHGAQEEALPESEASANSHHQNDATSEVGEGEGEGAAVAEGPKQQEQQKQRERKRGMLMSMSRADHSRFGMEAGGRSTLRAKSKPKERGELTHAFPALDTPVPPDSGETPPLEEIQRPEPPALLSRSTSLSLLAPLESGFVVEPEQDCEIATTFFASEGTNWYREHFYGHPHRNFLAIETPLGTVLISCKREEKVRDQVNGQASTDAPLLPVSNSASFHRVLLFTQDGDQKMFVPATSIDLSGKGGIDKLLGAVNPLLFSTNRQGGESLGYARSHSPT